MDNQRMTDESKAPRPPKKVTRTTRKKTELPCLKGKRPTRRNDRCNQTKPMRNR